VGTAHTEAVIERTIDAAEKAFAVVAQRAQANA
jgi:hypothetical protein